MGVMCFLRVGKAPMGGWGDWVFFTSSVSPLYCSIGNKRFYFITKGDSYAERVNCTKLFVLFHYCIRPVKIMTNYNLRANSFFFLFFLV